MSARRQGSRARHYLDKSSATVIARGRDLAAIHIAKAQLGLDDDTYRQMLWTIARVDSAADLDHAGRRAVLAHLRERGATSARAARPGQKSAVSGANEWAWVSQAAQDRQPLLRRIIVFCRDLGIARGKQVAYVEGIARQMAGANAGLRNVETPLALCGWPELRSICIALEYRQRHLDGKGRP